MSKESRVIQQLIQKGISVSTAESCTGGLIAAEFTAVSGVSKIYHSGIVTYSNEAKEKLLKVKKTSLKKYGAVSSEVCSQMCFNLHKISKSQLTISTTGVAGPSGGTKLKPVGTVYVGICFQKNIYIHKLMFSPKLTRLQIQKGTVKEVFALIQQTIHG
jgi:PncC family amidohydrolase